VPERLYQRCNERSCPNRTNARGGYCEVHQKNNQRTRQASDRGHALYSTALWRKVKRGFQMKYPERAWVCQSIDPNTKQMCGRPAKIVHHTIPHRGDLFIFMGGIDFELLAGACQACHNRETAREQQDIPEETNDD
jgi:5-methylcytosine-specific restriction endonuclease McrA